ncbi:TPA: hypothetical protein ACNZNV_000201 [Streptococcus pyogenes]
MKTKSKRFLKLATLCLALLGTTLLMGRPVKAEFTTIVEPHQEAWNRGKDDGYKNGLSGSDRSKRDDIVVPGGIESQYSGDYKDGYEGGFEEGRREARPIAAFFEAVWQVLTDIFGGWFGSNDSPQ